MGTRLERSRLQSPFPNLPPFCRWLFSKNIFFWLGNEKLYHHRQVLSLCIGQKLFHIDVPPPFVNAHDVQAISIISIQISLFHVLPVAVGEAVQKCSFLSIKTIPHGGHIGL